MSALLLPKYLRLRREWQSVDPTSNHRQRLANELAQMERMFVDMRLMHFADTQPCEHVSAESDVCAASALARGNGDGRQGSACRQETLTPKTSTPHR